ncbi:exodeoxyribonuclease VII large subunit [Actibacterium mucosum KCTC 23349]|uniref:Exodeoxyribonuclease 7 large subunit n=1 Tax=Actibacterium mucosum KCTC 23349 TaxID=1454373 RepID=A0A037ZF09_9RHOB|nr:exodeoxyribonuclease VII large subunit [Actibacterium mucosum]KAJ54198.1 exodeoxyribonuclease VII large subunit [Actibacterium mucosum KCTC 23349]
MSDLIDDPAPGGNAPEFTVSEISGAVKKTIEGAFGRIRVRGEVGRVFKARSGHLYYDVKDDNNVLACTTWKGQVARLSVVPEEGMEVIVTGKLTAFGAQSKYNMNVDEVTVAGEGALMAMLEKRKKALAAEGLFAPERKKPLPYLPEIIGVITSPSGAVIRDILHRLADRFPRKVLIWPVAVQGQACAPEVARAIEGFNRLTPGGALPRPDLLIVARGGGSIEDLWGFNEEVVARAVAASDIPLISAVGHETDTTLIDFVSDKRAPTPTAAAELAVPVRAELLAWVGDQGARLTHAATGGLGRRGEKLRDLARALPRPESLLENAQVRLDRAGGRLAPALRGVTSVKRVALEKQAGALRPGALRLRINDAAARLAERATRLSPDTLTRQIDRQREALAQVSARLSRAGTTQVATLRDRLDATDRMRQSLGYHATLERGFAVVRAGEEVVTTKTAAQKAGALEIEFKDGKLPLDGRPAPRSAPKKPKPPSQGSLFD